MTINNQANWIVLISVIPSAEQIRVGKKEQVDYSVQMLSDLSKNRALRYLSVQIIT